jgi:hypothetical protein
LLSARNLEVDRLTRRRNATDAALDLVRPDESEGELEMRLELLKVLRTKGCGVLVEEFEYEEHAVASSTSLVPGASSHVRKYDDEAERPADQHATGREPYERSSHRTAKR